MESDPTYLHFISIHVPARGTTPGHVGYGTWELKFQSTCPHGARQRERQRDTIPGNISIHVPARGTTPGRLCRLVSPTISIHVPARGTTRQFLQWFHTKDISIHVPARGTTLLRPARREDERISIHVPARGTTLLSYDRPLERWYFNPRARTGHDCNRRAIRPAADLFQSTCPHGARLSRGVDLVEDLDFNPRARTGHDDKMFVMFTGTVKFQSTCPHGARLKLSVK